MPTIKELLISGKQHLKKKGVSSYSLDAEVILAHVLQKDRSYLYTYPERAVDISKACIYNKFVVQRGKRLSVAHVLGIKEFFGLDMILEQGVFCPRPETEMLVEEVVKTFKDGSQFPPSRIEKSTVHSSQQLTKNIQQTRKKKISIYEIGVGSGAITTALAVNLPHAEITGCDISDKALSVTRKNLKKHEVAKRVKVFHGSLFCGAKIKQFDCIVSNPPYLSRKDYCEAEPEVRRDPRRALMAQEHGLRVLKAIIRQAADHLKGKGSLIFLELGHGQGKAVLRYAEKHGFCGEIVRDLAGLERIYKGQLKI